MNQAVKNNKGTKTFLLQLLCPWFHKQVCMKQVV